MPSMLYLGYYLILRGYSEAQGGEFWPVVVQMTSWVYISFMTLSVVGGLVVKTDEKATNFAGIGSRLCICCETTAVTAGYYTILTVVFQLLFMILLYVSYANLFSGFEVFSLENFTMQGLFETSTNSCGPSGLEPCPTVANAVIGFLCIFGLTFGMAFLHLIAEAFHFSAAAGRGRALYNMIHQMMMLVLGFICYMLLMPAYVNVFMVFAFANLHDTSWGTKGLEAQGQSADKQESEMKEFRLVVLVVWIFINVFVVLYVTSGWNTLLDSSMAPLQDPTVFLQYQFYVGFAMTGFKAFGSSMSILSQTCRRCCS